jgi:hypothetical protein
MSEINKDVEYMVNKIDVLIDYFDNINVTSVKINFI